MTHVCLKGVSICLSVDNEGLSLLIYINSPDRKEEAFQEDNMYTFIRPQQSVSFTVYFCTQVHSTAISLSNS